MRRSRRSFLSCDRLAESHHRSLIEPTTPRRSCSTIASVNRLPLPLPRRLRRHPANHRLHRLGGGPLLRKALLILLALETPHGAHAHVTQSLTLSAELAGGGRMYSRMEHAEVTDGAGVLEARGRIDWWATPHLSFGASLGTSLISNDQTFTVGFSGHIRAFDGHDPC